MRVLPGCGHLPEGDVVGMSIITQNQRKCIDSTDKRIVISAAAGTGKTFTLTQKIATMMQRRALEQIGDILAITFTRKAASELVGRIRSALRSNGMHEQALLVDNAWISTIHGMCSRILRAHALELGIDPAFEIATDDQASAMLSIAIEAMLDAAKSEKTFDELFIEYAYPQGSAFSAQRLILKLVDEMSGMPSGSRSIELGPTPMLPAAIAKKLRERLRGNVNIYRSTSDLTDKAIEVCEEHVGLLEALDEAFLDIDGIDLTRLFDILEEHGKLRKPRATKSNGGVVAAMADDIEAVCAAAAEAKAALCQANLKSLIRLTEGILKIYAQTKRSSGYLDNSDLLALTHKALMRFPAIADEYREQFKIIMVDEFQDTDQTQIDIITRTMADDAQLCTVGDAQQSIYRFRGADISVFEEFIDSVGADPIELGENFRSHVDILKFANSIFGQPHVFGKRFLELKPGLEPGPSTVCGLSRLNLIVARGAASETNRRYEAAAIARKFAEFRDSGAFSAGDMVLLLGAMTHADIFSQALEAEGFQAVIAGGSGFWTCSEVVAVSCILGCLASPHDSQALFEFLMSGIVDVGDAEIANLGIAARARHIDIAAALLDREIALSASLEFVRDLFGRCRAMLRHRSVAYVVEAVLSESGFISRLAGAGSVGSASCANLFKAIRIIEEYESQHIMGVSNINAAFKRRIADGSADRVGVLFGGEENAVRIMTIHASKGLQFKVAGLAEFSSNTDRNDRSGTLALVKRSGSVYASLDWGRTKDIYPKVGELAKKLAIDEAEIDFKSAPSASAYSRMLRNFDIEESYHENDRKMYVGITRAAEVLVIGAQYKPIIDVGVKEGTALRDLCTGIFGIGDFPSASGMVDFGGSHPCDYQLIELAKDENGNILWVGHPDYKLPVASIALRNPSVPILGSEPRELELAGIPVPFSGFFSYSSLSHADPDLYPEDLEVIEASGVDGESSRDGVVVILGLAFHAVCERMALTHSFGDGTQSESGRGAVRPLPTDSVLDIARNFKLTPNQIERLRFAVATWVASDVAAKAAGFASVRPEVPFCIRFADSTIATPGKGGQSMLPYYLNGEIDLLCTNDGKHAFVVDYKTGGSPDETPEALQDKHRLQAMCYAYALLDSGYESVELAFVRIEQVQSNGQPQIVEYTFDKSVLSAIERIISGLL